MELDLTKFEPEKAKLIAKAKKYEWLKIIDENDKAWYETVHKAQMDLRAERLEKDKFFDTINDELNTQKKKVKDAREDIIWIIEWVEKSLKAEKERIDNIKEEQKRQKEEELNRKMNDRILQLHYIPANAMWFKDCTEEEFKDYLQRDERKYNDEQFQLEEERLAKEKFEQEQKEKEELERKQFEEQKLKQQEEQRIIDEARQKLWEEQNKLEEEKRKLEAEQLKQKQLEEATRLAKQQEEQRKQREEEEKKLEQARLKKLESYNKYIQSIWYTKWADWFIEEKTNTHIYFYKKIWEFKYM